MDMRLTEAPEAPEALAWADVDACALPTAQRPLRVAELDALIAGSLRSVERVDGTRARLLLAGGDVLADRARRLADAESACCSFFGFAVATPEEGQVALEVQVPPAYVDVLDALLARAEVRSGGAS